MFYFNGAKAAVIRFCGDMTPGAGVSASNEPWPSAKAKYVSTPAVHLKMWAKVWQAIPFHSGEEYCGSF